MAVMPHDFLTSAKLLITNSEEIDFRNAASRAYYSAFHNAEAKIRRLNVKTDKRYGYHQCVIEIFIQNRDMRFRKIGTMLQKCKRKRTDADYKLHAQFSKRDAMQTIELTEKIVNRIKSLP